MSLADSETRGHFVDWLTQLWVRVTGRSVRLADAPWLDGPFGPPEGIGASFLEGWAEQQQLQRATTGTPGLLPDFTSLNGPSFAARSVSPAIASFYERTSEYELDSWAHWCGPFRPFGWLLAVMFSRRLQQMNMPLTGLDTSRGMTSAVIPFIDGSKNVVFTAWVRELLETRRLLFAGAYSSCRVPLHDSPCVRVVFPLPNGNAVVIMRPQAQADGSLLLISPGDRFGGPGFYFTVRLRDGFVKARSLRTMRETIRVYPAGDREVRADHRFTLWSLTFLRIHYRMRKRL